MHPVSIRPLGDQVFVEALLPTRGDSHKRSEFSYGLETGFLTNESLWKSRHTQDSGSSIGRIYTRCVMESSYKQHGSLETFIG
jgi:hypothetical protein